MSKPKTPEIYSQKSRIYEQKWQSYLSHTHQKLLGVFQSSPGHRILDVSAGTGLFAHHLIEKKIPFDEIVLNDASSGMLDIAKERFGTHPEISFSHYFAESLDFEPSSFDSVISLNAFHNYEDQQKALSEICRVLKPDGRLYILDWNRKGFFKLINFCFHLFSGEFIQTASAEELHQLLQAQSLHISLLEEWQYRYWKFYLVVAEKSKSN